MLKGFSSETTDTQVVFRKLLEAMAHPGSIQRLDLELEYPDNLHAASAGILLTLLDFETTLWSDLENASNEIQWIKFHTGAPYVHMKNQASFALVTDYDNLKDPELFNQGTIESPDHSATVIIQTRGIDHDGRIRLTGPGIETETYLRLKGIRELFLTRRSRMNRNYPLGIDMIFSDANHFVSIPRTTRMEIL